MRIWDKHVSLLGSRKCGAALKAEIETWRCRNQLADHIQTILAANNGDTGLEQVWHKLRGLGGHPEVDSKSSDIELLIRRSKAWQILLAVPRELSEEVDRRMVAAWQENLFSGWSTAAGKRAEFDVANTRLTTLKEIEELSQGTMSFTTEDRIAELGKSLPREYRNHLHDRVASAGFDYAPLTEYGRWRRRLPGLISPRHGRN